MFKGVYIPRTVNSTTLILLLKKLDSNQISEFHPISLSNFFEKIISKISAVRPARLLPKLIDDKHAGFVQGRNIATHIVLTQDIIRGLNRKATGGNVIYIEIGHGKSLRYFRVEIPASNYVGVCFFR